MERFFYSVLPLIWLLAAAGVALLLYKSSRAFIQAERIVGIPVKDVRVTGSIAIFAIVYVLLWQTTEKMLVYDRQAHTVSVDRSSLTQMQDLASQTEVAAVRLASCADIPMRIRQCPAVDVDELRDDAERLNRLLSAAADAGGGDEEVQSGAQ